MTGNLSPDWQQQAAHHQEKGEYSQAASLYEQAIETEPEITSYYWHLGLLLLLQGKEEDAQLTWLSAMMEEDANSSNRAAQELFEVLTAEAVRQQEQQALELAWLIRQHAREVNPTNLDNLFKIIDLSLELGTFKGENLAELGLIQLLNSQEATVEPNLLLSVLKKVLHQAPLEPQIPEFVEACVPYADPAKEFVEIVLDACKEKITYSEARPLLATRLAKICLTMGVERLTILKHLALFYQQANQHKQGIETAQESYALSNTLLDQIQTSSLLLRGLLHAGGYWEQAFSMFQEQQQLLSKLVTENPSSLDIDATSNLITATFYQPYFRDDLKKNRALQNQVIKMIQSNLQTQWQLQGEDYPNKRQFTTPINSKKVLRIGYLSHCLKRHSVGWLTRWLFKHHNHEQFQIYAYLFNYKSQEYDPLQEWFVQQADQAYKLEADSLKIAEQINRDNIDILVDLDSISHYITMQVMALKPAPVQVTWLGWDASGLPAIDYFIADPYVLPQEAQEHYREKIWQLPEVYVAVDGFEVATPTLRREQLNIPQNAVVYFSAQAGKKRHPETVRLQMKILAQVPNSYFLIKGLADEASVQAFFTHIAQEEGVDSNRLRFLPYVAKEEIHRANLAIADVVLDTYPYNGATTTLETLWMAVPLVTRVGEQFSARNSYTFMKSVGVSEGIAWSDEEYIEWGVKLGTDQELRKKVTWQLWQSRQTSPLWNAQQFTREMEKSLLSNVGEIH
ncbi:TPR repeat-containing protein [Halothece sp. PCC 7418]|uniref:O-linked N-acetylglucosamine transferase, SPINDLY family protein n=1 Tax=Halothece sp. (strain PCC 7418) TaxID=65093 RepID=UPI0002A06FDB|nr:hypothetical protein [Halothece sp. PCC 7418]AFZ43494.1 TPR repeat-containing protein [Halothece sp. PCC 7418]